MSSSTEKPQHRYRTTNCKDHNAALKARGSLTVCFDENMGRRRVEVMVPTIHSRSMKR